MGDRQIRCLRVTHTSDGREALVGERPLLEIFGSPDILQSVSHARDGNVRWTRLSEERIIVACQIRGGETVRRNVKHGAMSIGSSAPSSRRTDRREAQH